MNASKIACAALLACAVLSQTAWAAPAATGLTDLGGLAVPADATEMSYAYNVLANGQISGRARVGLTNTAFVGSASGGLTALANNLVNPNGSNILGSYQANSSNAAGIVVGTAGGSANIINTGSSGAVPVIWSGGTVRSLSLVNDSATTKTGRALDINSAGMIVGNVGTLGTAQRGQIWSAAGVASAIPAASNGSVAKVAMAVNDNGLVVGEAWADGVFAATPTRRAGFVYDSKTGVTSELLPVGLGISATGAVANELSNAGHVVGRLFSEGSTAVGSFIWHAGIMSLIPQLAGTTAGSFIATGVNSKGWVVGTALSTANVFTPWVSDGSNTYSLSSLLPAGSNVKFIGSATQQANVPLYINDAGVIVGSMASFNGSTTVGHAFALTIPDAAVAAAVPEPQSYALLLGGLGVLGWVARRRLAVSQG